MKWAWLLMLIPAMIAGAAEEHPTGSRTTPPIIQSVSPRGLPRGMTAEFTVEGLNLADASAIYFSEQGLSGRILRIKELPDLPEVRLGSAGTPSTVDLGPLPPRNQVTIEMDIAPDAPVGPVSFRLQTPLGTTSEARFVVEPFYGEAPDREPNDTPEQAFETYLPAILVGAISKPGDVDFYKITVQAGEQIVFDNAGAELGSSLQPVVTILTPDQATLKEFGPEGVDDANRFAYTFESAGTYYVRIADYEQRGRGSNFYRIKAGAFPIVTSAYPLGLQRGSKKNVQLTGYRIGPGTMVVEGQPSAGEEDSITLRPSSPAGPAFSTVRLAVGVDPEVEANGTNTTAAAAQRITAPLTVNGRIPTPQNSTPGEHYYRLAARKGEKLVIETLARRYGSDLDSLLEILDAKGQPVERATARAVWETTTTLAERDSVQRGIRMQAWNSIVPGDYLMIGGEIVRVESLPKSPDADVVMEGFGGQRVTYFDTTAEAHAIDKPVYKVQIHEAGKQFAPNGLPLAHLYYRNDDGGPGYGKDSIVHFTAPADGEYLIRVRDIRGEGGDKFAYRLNVRPPRPDFRLRATPENPNIPRGGYVPLTVTAFRMDGFDGPVEISVQELPEGVSATKAVIASGQDSATLLLSATGQAKLDRALPLKIIGEAKIEGRPVIHAANSGEKLQLVSLMPQPDVVMTAETQEVVVEAGGTAEIAVSIRRQNDFGGRVPVDVRNLPPRVSVLDVGLNGVLINEEEDRRSFTLEALPNAEPVEQLIYVAARVETRSPLPSSYAAPQAIRLKVLPRKEVSTRSSVWDRPTAR